MVKNKLYSDRINIIIGSHYITDPNVFEEIKRAGRYIIIQTEVLREGGISSWPDQPSFQNIYVPFLRQASAVWDGIESNQVYLKKLGIHAERTPHFGYLSALEEVVHKKTKDIDFLYYGSITPHRQKMIEALKGRGGNVVCIFDEAAIFRNDYIARTRVNIAPIQAPDNNNLTLRINYLLNNRSIVAVERCHDQHWVEHCFPSAETENWVDLCLETLERSDLDQLAEKYYDQYRKLDVAHLFLPVLEKVRMQTIASPKGNTVSADSWQKPATPFDASNDQQSLGSKEGSVPGLTSIIIATFNRLEQTKKCVKNIRRHTAQNHEIIFVDNGSTDGTVQWLLGQVRMNSNYHLVENRNDVGRAKARNLGIGVSKGEFIVVMDDDAVVEAGWLDPMLHCLKTIPDAGIVGPLSRSRNNAYVMADSYPSNLLRSEYATKLKEQLSYRRTQYRNIDGFCMVFRRTLVNEIGLLDEQFETGKFEDDDFCLRSAVAGHANYMAGTVFVGRNGSGNAVEIGSSWARDSKLFDEKWTAIDLRTSLGKKVFCLGTIDKAETLHQKGQLDQAIAALIDGVKYAPEERFLYYHLAEVLLDAKLYKDALEAVESLPSAAISDLRRLEIIAFCKQGLGEPDGYIDQLREVHKDSPMALNLKGMEAYKHGDLSAAEDFFRQAIAVDPGYGQPYTNLGILKWGSNGEKEAFDYLEKGFVLSPNTAECVTMYHSAVTEMEQFARAEEFAREATIIHPENKRILFFHIDTLIKQHKYEGAMDEIEKALLNVGIDDGILAAALEIRNKVGAKEINKAAKSKGTLSLCMIVKNEEQHLPRCLQSVKPVADEMIIVDTGSADRTKAIAQAYGARVFDFPWTNDFSAARNHSLSMAQGDWVLVLDADEVISPLDYAALEAIVRNRTAKAVAYAMVTRNYTNEVAAKGWTANDRVYRREEAGTGWFPSLKVRLFPNRNEIRFQNPVHELVEPGLADAGLEIEGLDIPVHHYGRFDTDKLLKKGKEYFLLGKQKFEEMKGDVRALRELAVQACELGEFEAGIDLWKKVIEHNPNDAIPFLNISYAYLKLERYEDALLHSRRAAELDPTMKEAALNYAGSEFIVGDVSKATSVLERLLQEEPDYPPAIALIAAAYYVSGRKEEGLKLLERLRKMGFNCAEFFNEQYIGVVSQGRVGQAALLLEAAVESGNINKDTSRLIEEYQKKRGDAVNDVPGVFGAVSSG